MAGQRSAWASQDGAGAPTRRRMAPAQRKHGILEAARKEFARTGDPTATTIKAIAASAGIAEGVIYRHFESKEQLYFEAIVEPLNDAIAVYAESVSHLDPRAGAAEIDELRRGFWRQLLVSLRPVVPLLGLVLFGEPKTARKFYRNDFTSAVDVLATRWSKLFGRRGHPSREVALSVLGMTVMFAVDARFNRDFDLEQTVNALEQITRTGFWPELDGHPPTQQT